MKLIIITILIILVLNLTISAQTESLNVKAYKFDEIIQTSYSEDIKVRLFLLDEELKKTEGSKAYIISYKGLADSKKTFSVEQEKLHRISKFLKLEPSKFVFVNAEFRLKYLVELWIVPKNAEPPKPSKQAEKYDEFGAISERKWKTRFDKLLEFTSGNCSDQIYIIIYPQANKSIDSLGKKYLDYAVRRECDLNPRRIVLIQGSIRKRQLTEIWIVPEAVELPKTN